MCVLRSWASLSGADPSPVGFGPSTMDGGESSANRQGFLLGGIQGACLVHVACVCFGGCVWRAHGARRGRPRTLSRERRQRRRKGVPASASECTGSSDGGAWQAGSTGQARGRSAECSAACVCRSVVSRVSHGCFACRCNKRNFGYTQMPVDRTLTYRTRDV